MALLTYLIVDLKSPGVIEMCSMSLTYWWSQVSEAQPEKEKYQWEGVFQAFAYVIY